MALERKKNQLLRKKWVFSNPQHFCCPPPPLGLIAPPRPLTAATSGRAGSFRFISCKFEVIQNPFHALDGEIVNSAAKGQRLQKSEGKRGSWPSPLARECDPPVLEVSILRHQHGSDELDLPTEDERLTCQCVLGTQGWGPSRCPSGPALGSIPHRIVGSLDWGRGFSVASTAQLRSFSLPGKESILRTDWALLKGEMVRKAVKGKLLFLCFLCPFMGVSSFQAAIRKELNEFKSTEMEVHELSRHLTR